MPRTSLLWLVAVGATNRATVLENEKHKTKFGSLVTYEHLPASLRILTSTVGADIPDAAK